MDEGLIMEVWDTFKEYISDKNKAMAASQYVDFLIGKEVDITVLESFMGYDSHLDEAISLITSEKDDEEYEEEDYYDEEDY